MEDLVPMKDGTRQYPFGPFRTKEKVILGRQNQTQEHQRNSDKNTKVAHAHASVLLYQIADN
jgi:hypothetical protein